MLFYIEKNLKEVIEQFEYLVNLVQSGEKEDIFDFSKVEWITPQQSIFPCSMENGCF